MNCCKMLPTQKLPTILVYIIQLNSILKIRQCTNTIIGIDNNIVNKPLIHWLSGKSYLKQTVTVIEHKLGIAGATDIVGSGIAHCI